MSKTATAAATIELDGKHLTLEQIRAVAEAGAPVSISAQARKRVQAARAFVEEQFDGGMPIYGVTTGFGRLANVTVPPSEAATCVNAFKPKIVYPYHFKDSNLDEFSSGISKDSGVEVRIRKWY